MNALEVRASGYIRYRPCLTTIGGVQNGIETADCPTDHGVNEGNIVEVVVGFVFLLIPCSTAIRGM